MNLRGSNQPRNNLVKDKNCDLLAVSHILRLKNYSSQLLNVHNASDVRQIEIHTDKPLVSDRSHLEVPTVRPPLVGKVHTND
jgi:predicted metallo-beta-lactamase superfamily hydrolase